MRNGRSWPDRRCLQRAAPVRAQAGGSSSVSSAVARWLTRTLMCSRPGSGKLLCVCDTCAILFPGGHARYRRVPDTIRVAAEFSAHRRAVGPAADSDRDGVLLSEQPPPGEWSPSIPVRPVPTESLLPLGRGTRSWLRTRRSRQWLPDVEALVVNRLGQRTRRAIIHEHRPEYFILPIDQCFRLVGLIRLHWKGLSGGTEVWREIAGFFAEIGRRRSLSRGVARA